VVAWVFLPDWWARFGVLLVSILVLPVIKVLLFDRG